MIAVKKNKRLTKLRNNQSLTGDVTAQWRYCSACNTESTTMMCVVLSSGKWYGVSCTDDSGDSDSKSMIELTLTQPTQVKEAISHKMKKCHSSNIYQ